MAFEDRPDHLTPPSVARLAPGLRVVGRGLHHLQVGLYDDRRVLLARSGQVEHTLDMLLQRGPLDDDPDTGALLDQLDRHGCLAWERPAPATRARVAVLGGWTPAGQPDVAVLLAAAGVDLVLAPDADVVAVLSLGEVDREQLDPLVRSRTTHVVVRLVDGGAVLGPFVVPGTTACLRCIDAHACVGDPDHTAVTSRYVRSTQRARADGTPDLDPVLASVALAWVLRDVVAHLAGREPSTWSRTLHLGAAPTSRSEHEWPRHPRCGCSWPTGMELVGTEES